ncbi:MAG: helix-turn-helix domain-containing protein [Alphaproteobacteria bacterium]|nr:helix-turn-helix domain-containing protein [Alphaproteobacteria bacterium]
MEPDRVTQAVWTALVTKSRRLLETVEADLKKAGHPPLAWYDTLLELEKAGDNGLRPFELRARILLPQYSTSRLLDRMVKAGLVTRFNCKEDGRGQVMTISEQGLAVRKVMWPIYAKVLSEGIGAKLTSKDTVQLAALLSKL